MSDNQHDCRTPEKHQAHLCELRAKGLMMELDLLAEKPVVRCAKCGGEANRRDAVCQPIDL